MDADDGSDSNGLKPYVSHKTNKFYIIDPTNRNVKLFFCLLLPIFITFKTLLMMSSTELDHSMMPILAQTPQAPAVNMTLLNLASVDLSDEKTKREIRQLLETDVESLGGNSAAFSFNHGGVFQGSQNFNRHLLSFKRELRAWWRAKSYQPLIMSELIKLVKNRIDPKSSNNTSRYTSCAVVGNGGILLKTEFGELIDSHEAVIRLNNAKIEGYEKRVGSKTTISFVNSNILHACSAREGCFCHPYGESVPIVTYICQALHFWDYTVCNSLHAAPLIVTDPKFDVLCARIVKYYSLKLFFEKQGNALQDWVNKHDGPFFHYSSGMQAVMLALGVCENVSIFGFGKWDSSKHHYHTDQQSELRLHDYEAEYEFYRDLIARRDRLGFIPRSFNIPPIMVY